MKHINRLGLANTIHEHQTHIHTHTPPAWPGLTAAVAQIRTPETREAHTQTHTLNLWVFRFQPIIAKESDGEKIRQPTVSTAAAVDRRQNVCEFVFFFS